MDWVAGIRGIRTQNVMSIKETVAIAQMNTVASRSRNGHAQTEAVCVESLQIT